MCYSFILPVLPPEARSSLDSQLCLLSASPTLSVGKKGMSYLSGASPWRPPLAGCRGPSVWVKRACPISLGPHLGAHPWQGAEGLVGLFIRGHSKLLQPSWPTLLFEDGSGTGTYIAGTVPQAQLPELSLYFWTCGSGEERADSLSLFLSLGYCIRCSTPMLF